MFSLEFPSYTLYESGHYIGHRLIPSRKYDYLSEAIEKATFLAWLSWVSSVWITEYNEDGDEVAMHVIKREEVVI